MSNRGVTLIELMIAVGIIGILVVALAFSYQGWQGRYKVEGEIKNLQTDLMNARAQAMQRAATFLVDFPTNTSYRVANDRNGNGAIDVGEPLPTFPKIVEYTINNGVLLTFDSKGLIYSGSPPVLIAAPWTISITSTVNPDLDCIRIESTRVNAGQMQGGICNVK